MFFFFTFSANFGSLWSLLPIILMIYTINYAFSHIFS